MSGMHGDDRTPLNLVVATRQLVAFALLHGLAGWIDVRELRRISREEREERAAVFVFGDWCAAVRSLYLDRRARRLRRYRRVYGSLRARFREAVRAMRELARK